MSTQSAAPQPKLLKARQYHSRVFAVLLVAALLVVAPQMGWGGSRNLLMLAGYVLVIIGVLGRIYCSVYIGGRKNDTVVRSGPFSVVRNPLYVFSFIATAGVGLQSGMLSMCFLLLVAYAVYYPFVVAKEEGFLAHKFGESYAAYVKEVPRWWPNPSLWKEPEHIESMPKFVRRTMFDAATFFLPLPFFVVVSMLQHSGVLPVLLVLP